MGITDQGFPVFDSRFDTMIPEQLRGPAISDAAQMRSATAALREHLAANLAERALFTPEQLEAIDAGAARIPGFTWHHNEDGVTLQLVDRSTHQQTGHRGGRVVPGGRP